MIKFANNKRAVTLLELLIVLSIITLIVSLPLVSFGRFTGTAKLKMAARNVSSVLKLAKSHAVSAASNYSFNINTANFSEFWITDDAAAKTVGDVYKLPETITFASSTPQVPITFKPSSGKSTSVDIVLAGPRGDTKTVKVSDASGKVVIE